MWESAFKKYKIGTRRGLAFRIRTKGMIMLPDLWSIVNPFSVLFSIFGCNPAHGRRLEHICACPAILFCKVAAFGYTGAKAGMKTEAACIKKFIRF